MRACGSQWEGIEGPCLVSDAVDQKVVCCFGPIEVVDDEKWLGESAVSCVFRKSCRVLGREIGPLVFLVLDLPDWAGQPVCGRAICRLCIVGTRLV